MGFTNVAQLQELFLSGGMGFLLGAYYDLFRILRRFLRSGTVSVCLQDCLYFTSSAVVTFLFLLAVTGGVLRVFVLVGMVLGFVAYRHTVGRVSVRVVTLLLNALARLAHSINDIVSPSIHRFSDTFRGRMRIWWEKTRKKFKLFAKKS